MKVFISHSRKDKGLAQRVAATLQDAGLEVWDDQTEILPGDNWAEKVAQALRESEAMVVLFTPNAIDSNIVRREVEYALGEERYRNRLIPVLAGPPEKISEQNIPWILRRQQLVKLPEHERDENIKQIAQVLLNAA